MGTRAIPLFCDVQQTLSTLVPEKRGRVGVGIGIGGWSAGFEFRGFDWMDGYFGLDVPVQG